MQEAKHTPGPWAADFHGHVMAHGGTTNVASIWTTPDANYPDGRPYKANARLLAAAPELLEALVKLMKYQSRAVRAINEEYAAVLNMCDEAIAKATASEGAV